MSQHMIGIKAQLEYVACALLGVSGVRLAMIVEYMPTPLEATKAVIIGFLSAGAGIFLRWVWGKIQKRYRL